MAKKPKGRPTIYSANLAATICARMGEGRSLRDVCRDDDMPALATVFRWLGESDKASFKEQYTKAREAMADAMADELLEIADDGTNDWAERKRQDGSSETILNGEHIQRSRLRVDARKWLLSKVAPKKYGDRIVQEHTGDGLTALADALDAARKRNVTPQS